MEERHHKFIELETTLALIGYTIEHSDNLANDFIIDNNGKSTGFVVFGDCIQNRMVQNPLTVFWLDHCDIKTQAHDGEKPYCVFLSPINGKSSMLSFHKQ